MMAARKLRVELSMRIAAALVISASAAAFAARAADKIDFAVEVKPIIGSS